MVPVDRSFLERIGIILKQTEDEIYEISRYKESP